MSLSRRQALVASATLVLLAAALLAPLPLQRAAAQERRIKVSARSFAYEPGTVYANVGDTMVIDLESEDAVHGLYVDGYGVSAHAEPGRPAQLRFVASQGGAFRMRCNVACGSLHPFMIGKLVVGPNLPWLRAVAATLVAAAGAIAVFWPRPGTK